MFTDINIPVEYYRDVLRRQAVVNKGITFRFRNQVGGKFQQEEYCYPGGIKQYIEELVGDNAFTMPVYWETERRGRDAENRPEMKLKITASFCFSKQVSHIEFYHNSSWLNVAAADKAVAPALRLPLTSTCGTTINTPKPRARFSFRIFRTAWCW